MESGGGAAKFACFVAYPFSLLAQLTEEDMPSRTSSKHVTFLRSFRLSGFDHVQPPGIYRVDTVEELIEAVSFAAWRRVSTTMPLTYNGFTEYMPVDPGELDRALASDAAVRRL